MREKIFLSGFHSRLSEGRCLGLDLLRAAAILMVLFSHWTAHFGAWFGLALPGAVDVVGDTGVEIFFALSGFLIGRILLDIVRGRPTWHDYQVFLTRRAMRTLPLYFLWLALLLLMFPPQQDAIVTAFRYLTLTQNLIAPMPPDYYFAVTWSLTVEEWFYLLFGAGLIAASRQIGGSRALAISLAIFMVVPLALRLILAERSALVFLRIDEIAYGVLMARLYASDSRIFRHPGKLLAVGLVMMGLIPIVGLAVSERVMVPITSNFQVIGGALCVPAALRLTRAAAWFERPVRWLAARSYALYLIHLTLLVDIVEQGLVEPGLVSPVLGVILAIAIPFPLAELSYRFLEAPLMRRRPRQGLAPMIGARAPAAA